MTTHINSQKLRIIIKEEDWDQLLEYVKPKHFVRQESEMLPDASILAQMCEILVTETTPDMIKILCLKCLGNSCLDTYKYKRHTLENIEFDEYNKNLYNELAMSDLCEHTHKLDCDYPHDSHFPYDGVIKWTIYYIKTYNKSTECLTDKELDIFRLSIQFLCNLFTYACSSTASIDNDVLKYLDCDNLKQAILNSMQSHHRPLISAACIYVHNALKELHYTYFANNENALYLHLLKPIKEGFTSAKDAFLCLLHQSNGFENVYNNMAINEKLDLLEIIYNELWKSWQSDHYIVLTDDQAEFLALTFCKNSDLILKTVDTCVDSVDPTEIIFMLNILGLLTTRYKFSKNARPLLINCKYLLMSLHMLGKEGDNYFTPITNLSQVAPSSQEETTNVNSLIHDEATIVKCDPQDHPAYGFKAGLIQVIANMVHKNKMCQDLFREIDGIPLLMDCCNIDARNPLILQWTIFAVKNLCEGNPENQDVIRNCKMEGVPNNSVLETMGLTLHEDTAGNSIRIAPLRRD